MQMVIIHHIGIGVKIIKKMIIKQASNLGYVKVDLVLKLNMNVLAFLVEYSYKGCSVFSLGIYPALLIAFSPLTGMYAYNVKINKKLVESVKKGLDQYQPSITACSYQLPNILNIDDIQKY
jgi:hypothetical protein